MHYIFAQVSFGSLTVPHNTITAIGVGLLALFVAACDSDSTQAAATSTPLLTAATLGVQKRLSNLEYAALEPYQSADIDNGKAQAQICKACHSLEQGGPNMIGPALHGFFGRAAGEQPGFQYTAVLQQADFFWTPRALEAWLVAPGRFLPGNMMVFPGVANATDRNDLIAYLLDVTSTNTPTIE